MLHSNLIFCHLHVYTVNIAQFISITVQKEIIFFVVTLPLWFVHHVLYFASHFVSLVFICLIIFRVQIKKGGAYSQLSTLQQTVKYFTRPLLVFLGLKEGPEGGGRIPFPNAILWKIPFPLRIFSKFPLAFQT